MSSLALALKYRPKRFSDLVGQEAISQTLSMALDKDRVVHAYLFSGLRGSGKTSSARIFARALECEQGPTSTPCGECDICKATLEGRNIDIVEMDAASNRSIDSIRDLIEQTKYAPTMSRFKVFIIDEVHMLTKEAFNALLKTLEEPPPYVKFILATTDPLKLPATILSRTQHFRFKKIPHKAVIAHLEMILEKEGVGFEQGALDIIARSGGGSLRDTLTLTDQAINYCDKYLTIPQVTQMLGIVDPKNLHDFFASIMHDDEQAIVRCLEILGEYECEMVIDEMLIFLKDMLLSRSKDFPLLLIDRFLGILSQAKSLLHLNPDGAFVLLLLSLKMREAMKLKDISDVISQLESTQGIFAPAPEALVAGSSAALSTGGGQDSSGVDSSVADSGRQSLDRVDLGRVDSSRQDSSAGAESTPTDSHSVDSRAVDVNPPESSAPESTPSIGAIYERAFATLVAKIADRSYELGEAFKRSVVFREFAPASSPNTPSTLCWQSSGDESDRAKLREHFGLIREFAKEIFAPSTELVIKNLPPHAPSAPHVESVSSVPSAEHAEQSPKPAMSPSSAESLPATPSAPQDFGVDSRMQARTAPDQAGSPALDSSPTNPPAPESSTPTPPHAAPESSAAQSPHPEQPQEPAPTSAPLSPKDLILYETQEIRPDHIAPEVLDEVPWRRESLATSPSNLAQPPSTSEANSTPESTSDSFKQENHALIQSIKQHFGATNMRIEHNGS